MRFIIKVARDKDEYVEWSTIVESPTFIGNRAEITKHLAGRHADQEALREIEDRLDKADELGSSSYLGDSRWEDDGEIFEQRGICPRDKIGEFTKLLLANDLQAALRLCLPFEDELKVRGLED